MTARSRHSCRKRSKNPYSPAEQPSAGHFYARNAKKHPAKMQGAFVAGALGLEPRAYGFGDRRSTN